MTRRLPALMQLFPQIDPWNVWQLPFNLWEVLARRTDDRVAEARKARRG